MVAEGANAEFGRSNGGFVNVVTKSGTNQLHGSAHFYFKNDGISSAPKRADGTSADKFDFSQYQTGFTLGGPLQQDKALLLPGLRLPGRQLDQADRSLAHRAAGGGLLLAPGQPQRERPHRPHQRRPRVPGQARLAGQPPPPADPALQLHLVRAGQRHLRRGLLGHAAPTPWSRTTRTRSRVRALSNLSPDRLNEFRFQWAREYRPRPYDGPDITGQSRPLPDTAFDFGRAYRFGMPFFIPVDYFDERVQFNDNLSIIKGRHQFKFGVEFNRVHSNQTFRGFQNGRYIFGSTDGFLNYAQNPRYVECSNGTTSQTGSCPAGASITGPLLLSCSRPAWAGSPPRRRARRTSRRPSWRSSLQDKWQPNRNLTIQYGLRWEMQKQADVITPADRGLLRAAHRADGHQCLRHLPLPVQRRDPLRLPDVPAAPGHLLGPRGRRQDGGALQRRTLLRPHPGPVPRHVALDQRQPRRRRLPRQLLQRLRRHAAGLPEPAPGVGRSAPPTTRASSSSTRTSRTRARSRRSVGVEREVATNLALLVQYNYAKGEHITRFFEGNDTAFGCPWGTGLGADGANGIVRPPLDHGLDRPATAKSQYHGITFGLNRRWANNFQFQAQLHDVLGQVRRRQRARPLHLPLHRHDQPRRRVRLLRPRPAPPLQRLPALAGSGPGEREPALLVPLGPAAVPGRDRHAVSQAPFGPTSDRIRADGSIVERNTGRKDNMFSSLDLRLSREFRAGDRCASSRSSRSSTCSTATNLLAPADHQPDLQLRRHDPRRPGRPAPGAVRAAGDLVGLTRKGIRGRPRTPRSA